MLLFESSLYKTNFKKEIFDLDANNKPTNKAQRYQHIVKFFLNGENRPFKITEIQDVAISFPEIFKVDTYREKYREKHKGKDAPLSQIKKNLNHQFNKYLRDLEEWGLVSSRPAKSIKGGTETKEYTLSKLGKTFALIIEFDLAEEKQRIYDKLFDYWKSYLSEFSTSLDLFCIKYLDRCKESGIFNEFAYFFINAIKYGNQHIRNISDLFTQMTLVKINDVKKNQTLLGFWEKSFGELDEGTKELFLNHMSIHINRTIATNAYDYAKFELKRYERRYISDCIIAEFCCSCCHSYCEYKEVSVLSYISYVFNQPTIMVKRTLDGLKCKNCEANKMEMTIAV
jgi:hypothetical protein